MTYEPFRPRLMSKVRPLMSPALLAYAISGMAAVASFAATIVLARSAGATVVGHYALAATTANLLATFSLLGMDWIAMREVAGDLREGISGHARARFYQIAVFVFLSSFAVAAIYLSVILLTPISAMLGADQYAMIAVILGIIAWPMLRLGYSGLRAAGLPIAGQFFEALPTFCFAAIILILALSIGVTTAAQVTLVFFSMQLFVACGAWVVLIQRMRSWGPADASNEQINLRAGVTLMSAAFLQIFSEWMLLAGLSATASPADAGAFRVAFQILTIAGLVVSTTETYVAPKLAGDFRAGRLDLAKKRHARATVLMVILAGPILLIALFFSEPLLKIAFGPEFIVAAGPVSIMAIGQLFNIVRGPIGSVLLMSGNEQVQLKLTIVGIVSLILLGLVLIPKYGIMGAAIAYAVPIILRSILGYVIVRKIFAGCHKSI